MKKIFIPLIILIIIGIMALPNLAAQGLQSVLPWIGEKMGKSVQVQTINLSWSGRGELHGLVVADQSGPILDVTTSIFDLGIMQVLNKNIVIDEVILNGASLNLKKTEEGLNISPGSSTPSSEQVGEREDWISWVQKAYQTWQDYRHLLKQESQESEASDKQVKETTEPWTFGINRMVCDDLKLSFEGQSWEFSTHAVVTGLGHSNYDPSLSVRGPDDFPVELMLSQETLRLKNCPIRSSKELIEELKEFSGQLNVDLTVSRDDQLNGHFALDQVTAKIRDDFPPLENFSLAGDVSGHIKSPRWSLSEQSRDSIQKSLTQAGKKKLLDEGEKRLNEKLEEKVGKEAGGLLSKGLKGLLGDD